MAIWPYGSETAIGGYDNIVTTGNNVVVGMTMCIPCITNLPEINLVPL